MVTGHCVIQSFDGSIEYDAQEHVMESAGSCPCRQETEVARNTMSP